ncbi:MAG: hypothetical protein ACXIT4_04580 [Erythrobacter sp.]
MVATLLLPAAAAAHAPAGGHRTFVTVSWVEKWDPAAQRWVRVDDRASGIGADPLNRETIPAHGVSAAVAQPINADLAVPNAVVSKSVHGQALAQYGPFRVLNYDRAALIGATDEASPRQFDAMLRDWPGLAVIEMVDAPGTKDDLANLALGRKIRAAGLETHVPRGGSVRSGAVELFLAGVVQTIAPGATFAVHSWMNSRGLEPRHFAEDAPENRLYLDYYIEMGMSAERARAFYAMTNSVPHAGALWLDAAAMERWIDPPARWPTVDWAPVISTGTAQVRDHRSGIAAMSPLMHSARQAILAANRAALRPRLPAADLELSGLARLDSQTVFP